MMASMIRAFDLTSATAITVDASGMVAASATSATQRVRSMIVGARSSAPDIPGVPGALLRVPTVKMPFLAQGGTNRVRFHDGDGRARRAAGRVPLHRQRLHDPRGHGQWLGIAVFE